MINPLEKHALEHKTISCSCCGNEASKTLFSKHDFAYQRCCECKTVRVNPQLTQSSIRRIYQHLYSEKSRLHSKELIIPKQQRHLLTTLADICGKRGSLLDVGCFEGQFLRVAQSLGWQVTGTEISAEAANFARSQWQLDVRQGTLETLHFDDAQFDAVVLNDVIEHLPDPLSTLHEIQRILRPKGVLYLWTPNFDSLTRRLAQKRWGAVIFPWHLYYFSAETLAQTCQRASLTPVSITTRNWLLDFGDRYQALTSGQPLQAPSTLRRRFTRLIDKATAPLFAAADRRDHHWGAQLALFAQK